MKNNFLFTLACYIILLLIISFLPTGCAVEAIRQGDFMKLSGWGADKATWSNSDGHQFSISKNEPIKVPDIVPLRS